MLVWRGHGLTAVIISVGAGLGVSSLSEKLFGGLQPAVEPKVFYITAAVANFLFAQYLGKSEERTFIDKSSGQEVVLKHKHDVMFIPVRYLTILYILLAIFSDKMPGHK